jgi:hypothetical protein
MASWARDVARSLLAEALPRRWAHVQGVAKKAEHVAASLALSDEALVAAAWLHDVGRGSPFNRSCAGQRPAARIGVAGAGSGLTCGFCSVDRRSTPAKWRARSGIMWTAGLCGRQQHLRW